MNKKEIEDLRKWADKKINQGYTLKDIKDVLVEKYDKKISEIVLKDKKEKESDIAWVKKFRDTEEKKKDIKLYSNLISYALLSLVLAISFWYSAKQFTSIEGLGISFGIFDQMKDIFNIAAALCFLSFIAFTMVLLFKKYDIYKKYIKGRLNRKNVK